MSAARFIMSVNKGVIEQTSTLARRYMTPKILPTEGSIRKSAGAFLRNRELFVKGMDKEEILPVYDQDDLPIASKLVADCRSVYIAWRRSTVRINFKEFR